MTSTRERDRRSSGGGRGAGKAKPFNNPFEGLKALPRAEGPKEAPRPAPVRPPARPEPEPDDAALFREAIGEVTPVRSRMRLAPPPTPPSAEEIHVPTEEAESLARLAELVAGDHFEIADADEHIEGGIQGFDVRVMKKLKAGEFSVQASFDLHGLKRDEAKGALERFIQKSRVLGHRCILVVTGRGLHSKDQFPVLKQGVQTWLTRGRLARQVLAFCSARPTDGGSGAVYVLLRR